MIKPEPAHTDAPSGQQDIAALQRHQTQLLYGGGVFLSLVIFLIMAMSIVLSIDDYKSNQLDDFRKAKLALDAAFIQRDAGYVRTLNMIEYAWREKAQELAAEGHKAFQEFASHGDQALVQASPGATPWLVLGNDVSTWPRAKIDRYLGLASQLSMMSYTSITHRGNRPGTLSYFYDPSEAIFTFGSVLERAHVDALVGQADKSALFSKFAMSNIDFNDLQALGNLRRGNNRLPFYGMGLPKILSSFGRNPSTGEPAIVGSMVAMDGDKPFGAFVVYEPIQPFVDQIRGVTQADVTLIAHDGRVVFGTGTDDASQRVAKAIQPLIVLQPAGDSVAIYRHGDWFFIAQRMAGTEWTLVRAYGWADILRGEKTFIIATIALALLLWTALWLLLLRQNRSVFTPALERAKRVYQSEELNRTMIETSPIGLCVVALDNARPLLQNHMVSGYSGNVPESVTSFYKHLLRLYAHSAKPLTGRPDAREFDLVLADESDHRVRHLLVAAMPIIYQNRAALFCAFRDVTARKELEDNLRQAREDSEQAKLAAESASRAKTAFVATMSHEIRTPLNGILGHLELLGRSKLEPAQCERLDRIRFSADTLLTIISDVLDFSRIEARQLEIDPISFELRPLIEQTALLYAPAAEDKGLKLYYRVESGLAPDYIADVHRIRQIINNLVSNAIKFTESGRVILRVRAATPQVGEQARLRFEVIDSGIGMTEQYQQQIFQPFSQADASISRRFGGSGLGLTLCQQISELMGGLIDVRSTPAVGSVFAFELPVLIDEAGAKRAPNPLSTCRLVLLSAAAEWRTEITSLLRDWGAEVMVSACLDEVDTAWLAQADALILFGTSNSWSEDDELPILAYAKRVVRATPQGPLLPEQDGPICFISCYSSAALLTSILNQRSGADVLSLARVHASPADLAVAPNGIVLLVDDNPVNRELIRQQLEILGYAVDDAEDGVAALRLWRDDRYCAVLTDISMPNMNGYDLARQLRSRSVTTPILAVTAAALTSEKVKCKHAGINELLLKPLSLKTLQTAMSHYVTQGGVTSEAAATARRAGHHPEVIRRVFVESGTRDLDVILDAAREHNTDALLGRIHSLKGALLMLGEKAVADRCTALERLIDLQGVPSALAQLVQLESEMRDLLRHYAEAS